MHLRLLPDAAIAALDHHNSLRPATDPIPLPHGEDRIVLVNVLGSPFHRLVSGDEAFRSIGEKAAVLAYELMRSGLFGAHRLEATAVIFSAFLYQNGFFWTFSREEFRASLEALERWSGKEEWLGDLGETASWISANIETASLDDLDTGIDL